MASPSGCGVQRRPTNMPSGWFVCRRRSVSAWLRTIVPSLSLAERNSARRLPAMACGVLSPVAGPAAAPPAPATGVEGALAGAAAPAAALAAPPLASEPGPACRAPHGEGVGYAVARKAGLLVPGL